MRYDFQISSLGIPNAVEGIVADIILLISLFVRSSEEVLRVLAGEVKEY